MSEELSVSPHHKNKTVETSENLVDYNCDCGVERAVERELVSGRTEIVEPAAVLMGEQLDAADGGDCELTAEVEQEVERVATLPTYQPTRSEIEEHNVTHSPFRPWCRHCAEGRGQEFGHMRRKGADPNRIPLVAFDYAGISDKGEFIERLDIDDDDDSVVRILIVCIRCPDDLQSCVWTCCA